MSHELEPKLHEEIAALCADGDQFVECEDYSNAIKSYKRALMLVPDPAEDWETSTWILTALGEAFFFSQNYDKAKMALSDAVGCPGGLGNPLIHLRLGQALFELGEMDKATDELARAYMADGRNIFEGENEKYFGLLSTGMKGVL